MMKLISIFCFVLLFSAKSFSQNNWSLMGGINHSNVITTYYDQQVIYNHTLNSPLWNFGFQLGVQKEVEIGKRSAISIGTKIQLRGDKKSVYEVFPSEKYHSMRFYYVMVPIAIKYKLLDSKEVYIKGGLSADYLLHQNKTNLNPPIPYFIGIDSFGKRLGLSGFVGFNFKITSKTMGQIEYSQSLTNITKLPIYFNNAISSFTTYKHQAFELSIFYTL